MDKKLEEYWKYITKHPYYKKYRSLINFSHMNGPHIEFFHQAYKYIGKRNAEIVFRNRLLKKMIDLNNLKKDNIYISDQIVNIIKTQCKYIVENSEYWIRYGYTDYQKEYITDTYKLLITYLDDYLKYSNNSSDKNINDAFYQYALEYMTGIIEISPYKVQENAVNVLKSLCDEVDEKYGSLDNAKKTYMTNLNYHKSESEIFTDAKNFLYKLGKHSETLFDQSEGEIKMISADKIKIKKMPLLKSFNGPISRTYENILFLNTSKMDKTTLLLIVAHEIVPGSVLSRSNVNLNIKNTKSKYKKYIKRGNNAIKEGWALYAEDLVYKDELYILLKKIQQATNIILDIGINTKKCYKTFTNKEALSMLQKYTLSGENILLKYIEKPGKMCGSAVGYFTIDKCAKEAIDVKKYNSLFMKHPLILPMIEEYIKKNENIII